MTTLNLSRYTAPVVVVVSDVVYGCFDSRGDTKIHSSIFPFYEVDTMSGTTHGQ